MKKSSKWLIIGILFSLAAAPFLVLAVYSVFVWKDNIVGSVIVGICALFFLWFGVMMIIDCIQRKRRFAGLKKNGTRYIGRIFAQRKEKTDDISLVVRYFDENGDVRQTTVTTDSEKKEDYPIATDVIFLMCNDDAAVLERCGVHFSEEEHERLTNILRETMKRRKEEERAKRSASRYTLFDITDIIAPDDSAVRQHMEEITADPLKYYAEHYDVSDIDPDYAPDADEKKWLCMAWMLIEQGYAYEADHDMEPERKDFAAWISGLHGTKKHALVIDANALEEEPYIPAWCQGVDEQWKEQGFCLGCIGIESESYVLFPSRTEELMRLSEIASDMCYLITYGAEM